MPDQKITALTELTTPAGVDVLAIVDDPAGSPITKKITFANIEGNIDHTAISNIGTNAHSAIDTHLADTTDAHTVSSDTLTLTNKTIDNFSNRVDADEVHVKIRNESGSAMTKGKLVYISGYNIGENVPLVSLTDASNTSTMPMIAMINDGDIANNATGHATMSGRVFDIDTSAFTAGDTVYVSTTPGELSTRPSGTTDQVQAIGIILRSHASNGIIQIIGAGRVNDITNDIDHATDLQNVGTNTHSQIDTSVTATGVNSTHVAGDGSDHADVATNTSKVSFTKTEIKGVINHGGTSGTSRPSGFDSVEWIGTVEPSNAANDDTWIDTT